MGGTSSRSESANVESSQSPHTNSPSSFTQPPSGGPGDIDPNVEEVTSQNRSSNTGQRWQWEDDEPLISAWLNVEQDPVVGDNQAGTTSWERIHQYCLEVDHKRFSTKKSNALKQRFHKIRTTVSSFYGFYAQADRHRASGANDDNVLAMAHNLYYKTYNVKFNMLLYWNILRHEPKFLTLIDSPT
ncbi:glutathione S-transferase T3-like [Punica granatum]|uniref:Glutathione S-transferase T3-like n=1 Tax=Punica granatum TaxID=22663 RepID=A0A6P8CAX6_PUNGR|nr:glutathione S-transferase T3-like [Punica granatum]